MMWGRNSTPHLACFHFSIRAITYLTVSVVPPPLFSRQFASPNLASFHLSMVDTLLTARIVPPLQDSSHRYISLFLPYLSISDLLMRRRANGSITVMLIVLMTSTNLQLGGFARTLLFLDVLEVTMDSHDARRPSWRRLFGTIRPYLRIRGKSLFAPSCQQAMHLRDRNTVNPT